MAAHPRQVQDLVDRGQRALAKGDLAAARAVYEELVKVEAANPQHWVKLAVACTGHDEAREEAAISRALSLDPMDLVALILRAGLLERQGRRHEAAQAYSAVVSVAPPMHRLHPDLHAAVGRAIAFREKYTRECGSFLDEYLAPQLASHRGDDISRFRDALDMLLGRRRRYDSQSAIFHYPHLPAIEFFPRGEFAWLDAVEAETGAIRDEFIDVLKSEEGFAPYITYPADVPHNQWAELNNSPRWSAFHLYKMGQRIDGNASRCPRTMQALQRAPQPDQPGRTPSAMFSLLKPRTRIPPHNGVTNSRLVVHLPLIVPEGCGFRVGNETRAWVPGKAWVFDDTIEHEAWNDSDKLRVVLIFDIWHPHLTPAERELVTALAAGLNTFTGGQLRFEL
ncbi:MAG TPA: aspartyl/asparaginyl beta-hydroxylase domain-containing protein [Usitatibacter sp.]|nr:aspartyl/asparaginyl beta-hydroxylase domain-containing protein [Usitatibacter sp.]